MRVYKDSGVMRTGPEVHCMLALQLKLVVELCEQDIQETKYCISKLEF